MFRPRTGALKARGDGFPRFRPRAWASPLFGDSFAVNLSPLSPALSRQGTDFPDSVPRAWASLFCRLLALQTQDLFLGAGLGIVIQGEVFLTKGCPDFPGHYFPAPVILDQGQVVL